MLLMCAWGQSEAHQMATILRDDPPAFTGKASQNDNKHKPDSRTGTCLKHLDITIYFTSLCSKTIRDIVSLNGLVYVGDMHTQLS